MDNKKSYQFSHAMCRKPSRSITDGLRALNVGDPNYDLFCQQHQHYVAALRETGASIIELEANESYPDSVFIEDAALCIAGVAIVLRPGAPSRFGEAANLMPELQKVFRKVVTLSGQGYVDGGDVLVTETDVFIGLSARTNQQGFDELASIVETLGYNAKKINTPTDVLHFKTDCGLLDDTTIFASSRLASTGCFNGYKVIESSDQEIAAANLIRFNDTVFISSGYPDTKRLLEDHGYKVRCIDTTEAAKVDGGLSCMSLRFTP
jgi:dimethylargininase